MSGKQKIKVKLPDGEIIERTPIFHRVGNFQMISVRYKYKEYIVNQGDEYLRGYPDVYELDFDREVKKED